MLPPPPSSTVLEANPNFSNLYNHLTTKLLAYDGSTASRSKAYESTHQRLTNARQSGLQEEILLRALGELAFSARTVDKPSKLPQPSSGPRNKDMSIRSGPDANSGIHQLPPELRDLVTNIAYYLSASLDPRTASTLPPDTEELMAEELSKFQQQLPEISNLLSKHLISLESELSNTASTLFSPDPSPSTPPAPSRTHSKSQPAHIPLSQILQTPSASTSLSALPPTLTSLLSALLTTQTAHTASLSQHIRTLEQQTHGTSARHLTSRTAYLGAVSRGVELKARIQRLEQEKAVYADEALMERLEDEVEKLEAEERGLQRREAELGALLGEYEEAGVEAGGRWGGRRGNGQDVSGSGEEMFRVLGERYGEIEGEIEQVKKDIERLETRVWRGR